MVCQEVSIRFLALGLKLRLDIFGFFFNVQGIPQLRVRWDNLSELMPNAGVEYYTELWWLVIRWCPIYFWRIVQHTFSLLSVSAQGLESEGRRGCGRTAKKPRKAGVANLSNFLGGFQTWREGPNHINVDSIRRDMSRFSITQGSERVVRFQWWW